MRRILCLYLPNWPIQRVRAGRKVGQVFNLPCLLHARDPRRGLVVAACDDLAAAAGVRIGMPLAEATTLIKHQAVQSPKPKVQSHRALAPGPEALDSLPHDPAADLAELARLAEHCERFSPLTGWETVEAELRSADCGVRNRNQDSASTLQSATRNPHFSCPECLFLDITGIGVLFGGEEQLAREALTDLARQGYAAQAAVADTIGTAWGLGRLRIADCGLRSEETPESPIVLTPFRNPHSAIRTLPLESLRLLPETLDLLAQLGITRLDELLALPRASLRARFGERLLLRLDQLTGAAQEGIVPYRPPPKFAAEWVLEYPAGRREIIEQIVYELVGRIASALAERAREWCNSVAGWIVEWASRTLALRESTWASFARRPTSSICGTWCGCNWSKPGCPGPSAA